jgi:hypothetical protein
MLPESNPTVGMNIEQIIEYYNELANMSGNPTHIIVSVQDFKRMANYIKSHKEKLALIAEMVKRDDKTTTTISETIIFKKGKNVFKK